MIFHLVTCYFTFSVRFQLNSDFSHTFLNGRFTRRIIIIIIVIIIIIIIIIVIIIIVIVLYLNLVELLFVSRQN